MRLEAVGKRYGLRQPWIVRDVSLDMPAGRLVRLEGRNGSGKSTLLRVLAGACVPSAGRVTGRPRTGYVPERFPPGLPFSPIDYLTHMGRVHGMRGAGLAGQVEESLDRLGATEYARRPMRSLSKGMCQKIAVAQALLPGPGLLVLDEAWTGLDQAARSVLDDAVASRLADGAAVVFVDHDPQRLAGLVSERWRVAGGRVTAVVGDGPGAAAAGPSAVVAVAAVAEAAVAESAEGGDVGDGLAAAGLAHPAGAAAGPVLIEVSGLSDGAASGLAGLPGVLAVQPAASAASAPVGPGGVTVGEAACGGADPVLIEADPGASDAVLRTLLARGDQVHILSVRSGEPSRPAEAAAP